MIDMSNLVAPTWKQEMLTTSQRTIFLNWSWRRKQSQNKDVSLPPSWFISTLQTIIINSLLSPSCPLAASTSAARKSMPTRKKSWSICTRNIQISLWRKLLWLPLPFSSLCLHHPNQCKDHCNNCSNHHHSPPCWDTGVWNLFRGTRWSLHGRNS